MSEEPMQVSQAEDAATEQVPAQTEQAPLENTEVPVTPVVAPEVPPTATDANMIPANIVPANVQVSMKMVSDEKESAVSQRSRPDLQSLPTRQYLDHTIVPILLQGMTALSKERPAEPIEYLASYLLKNKHLYQVNNS